MAAPILVLDEDAAEIARALAACGETDVVAVADAPPAAVADAVEICLGSPDRVAGVASALPRLRWIQSTWAGIRPLLPLMARRPEVTVTGVKGIFGPLMAEYVFGWLGVVERRLLDYRHQQQRRLWRPLPQRRMAGRTMAVLGLGSIGAHLARVAGAFDLRVRGVSASGAPVKGIADVRGVDRLQAAVAGSDYLVSVLPETDATRDLLDAAVFGALAPGAVFVNVGRGSAVVDEDLLAALRAGPLSAAVLDVFRDEPLPPEHPFWSAPGVHLTPHVAAVTLADDIAGLFLANLERWRRGAPLAHRVDPEKGY